MVNTASVNLFNPKDAPVSKLIVNVFNFFQYASNKIFSHICHDVSEACTYIEAIYNIIIDNTDLPYYNLYPNTYDSTFIYN